MSGEIPYYSIVIPAYNCEHSIGELLCKLKSVAFRYNHEILVVNDGSRDNTIQTLLTLKEQYKLEIINNPKNLGQGLTTLTGLKAAKGNFLITIDDDLEFDPLDILKLIKKQQETGADLVYGIPDTYKKGIIRKFGSYLIKTMSPLSKGSSFRLIRRSVIDKFSLDSKKILVDINLQKNCTRVESIGVNHFGRKYGNSNYSASELMKLTLNSMFYILFLKKAKNVDPKR